ncbi:MAG: hypothetical protein ACRDE5_16930, partial [Ginsengibacter sp.]
YEAVLDKWENKAKDHPLTAADVMNISQDLVKTGINDRQVLFTNEKITDAQEKRFEALQVRFMALEAKMNY